MEETMSSIAVDKTSISFDKSSKRWVLWLIAFGVSVALIATQAKSSVSCEFHKGSFDESFSVAFDIDRTDCRFTAIKGAPVLQIWRVWPYVGLRWEIPKRN
jgi:hypothetical protein